MKIKKGEYLASSEERRLKELYRGKLVDCPYHDCTAKITPGARRCWKCDRNISEL